jgi:hypothetical protein
MKKLTIILVTALVLSLAIVPSGAALAKGNNASSSICPKCLVRVTGGGSCVDDCTGNVITFGFNAQPVGSEGAAKGQFQLVDHTTKTRIHADIDRAAGCVVGSEIYSFTGKARVNNMNGYYFVADFYDGGEPSSINGDLLSISVSKNSGVLSYYCIIGGGNIQTHIK